MLIYGIISIILASLAIIACTIFIIGAFLSVIQDKETATGVLFMLVFCTFSIIWLITAILLAISC